jgi:hypothetical protein
MTRILFLLVFGHALCDYPLQGPFLSSAKNRFNPVPGCPWYQCMAAHCLIHAGAVYLVTGSLLLAALEFMAHVVIDDCKCAGLFDFNVDQGLHILCKVAFVGLLYAQSVSQGLQR